MTDNVSELHRVNALSLSLSLSYVRPALLVQCPQKSDWTVPVARLPGYRSAESEPLVVLNSRKRGFCTYDVALLNGHWLAA